MNKIKDHEIYIGKRRYKMHEASKTERNGIKPMANVSWYSLNTIIYGSTAEGEKV